VQEKVSQKDGMQTMDMALQNLVARGLVTREEAQSKSMTPNLFSAAPMSGVVGGRA
jgi:twitching motility protein PilT